MPGPVLEDPDSHQYVMDFAAYAKVDLLLGAIDQDETHAYNAALLVAEGGKRVQLYRKLHLVPLANTSPDEIGFRCSRASLAIRCLLTLMPAPTTRYFA